MIDKENILDTFKFALIPMPGYNGGLSQWVEELKPVIDYACAKLMITIQDRAAKLKDGKSVIEVNDIITDYSVYAPARLEILANEYMMNTVPFLFRNSQDGMYYGTRALKFRLDDDLKKKAFYVYDNITKEAMEIEIIV